MKTNQNMIRKMGQFDVIQRTSDGMFNATKLLQQWNESNPLEKRELDNFWKSTNLDKLMSEIAENELGINTVDFTVLRKALSKSNVGKNGGTWMHPVLYIKFAMYLSPRFEYYVLKFVSDEMIKYRHEAGDEYKVLGSAIKKIVPADFMQTAIKKVAEALNWVVFNYHESGIRNKFGDEQKQRELSQLEKKVADLINEGFITKYDEVLCYLRKQYQQKNYPKVFLQWN
jgi:hypothetical protein